MFFSFTLSNSFIVSGAVEGGTDNTMRFDSYIRSTDKPFELTSSINNRKLHKETNGRSNESNDHD